MYRLTMQSIDETYYRMFQLSALALTYVQIVTDRMLDQPSFRCCFNLSTSGTEFQ